MSKRNRTNAWRPVHTLVMVLLAAAGTAAAQDTPRDVGREFTAAEYAAHNAMLAKFDYDTPPRLLKGYVPLYPISRVMSGRTGKCVVSYTVGTDGKVSNVVGSPEDDRKMCDHAILALKRWTFSPAMRSGKVVSARMRVPISYDLR